MPTIRWKSASCFAGAVIFAMAPAAMAQATRTWVSGVGDDANPCSRTAPCKTFAGAISKTAAGGEISALDPGGFGGVTITKAITLNGDGNLTSILVAGTPGITINAGPSDTIIIRNLSLNGVGSGTDGINFIAGGRLVVDQVSIYSFVSNDIDIHPSGPASVTVSNSSMTGGSNGILVSGSGGPVKVSVDHVSIRGAANGIDAMFGETVVSNSVIAGASGFGLLADVGLGVTGTLTVESSMLTGNNVAGQANAGATLRLINDDVIGNSTGFGCGTGAILSNGNNRKADNVGGIVPVCSPTGTVSLQ